jgi:hypothetical protein
LGTWRCCIWGGRVMLRVVGEDGERGLSMAF